VAIYGERLQPQVSAADLAAYGLSVGSAQGPWFPGLIDREDSIRHARIYYLGRASWRKPIRQVRAPDLVVVESEILRDLPERLMARIEPGSSLMAIEGAEKMFYDLFRVAMSRCAYQTKSEVSPCAQIHPTAHVSQHGVVVGPGCQIGPNATVLAGVVLGTGVAIGPGAVLGAQGFQHRRFGDEVVTVPHDGLVVLGTEVSVGANCVVASGLLGRDTYIGDSVKLDAHVTVGHNCRIGARTLVAAGAVLSGSVDVGEDAWIGPGAVLSNGISTGDGSVVGIGAVQLVDLGAGRLTIGARSELLDVPVDQTRRQ
jgi:acetyltransferase-like isoleucine patch superfamily enzyme